MVVTLMVKINVKHSSTLQFRTSTFSETFNETYCHLQMMNQFWGITENYFREQFKIMGVSKHELCHVCFVIVQISIPLNSFNTGWAGKLSSYPIRRPHFSKDHWITLVQLWFPLCNSKLFAVLFPHLCSHHGVSMHGPEHKYNTWLKCPHVILIWHFQEHI